MADYIGKLSGAQIDALPEQIASINQKLDEILGNAGSNSLQSEDIDSLKEMVAFFKDFKASQTLKDVIKGNIDETEEELIFN